MFHHRVVFSAAACSCCVSPLKLIVYKTRTTVSAPPMASCLRATSLSFGGARDDHS